MPCPMLHFVFFLLAWHFCVFSVSSLFSLALLPLHGFSFDCNTHAFQVLSSSVTSQLGCPFLVSRGVLPLAIPGALPGLARPRRLLEILLNLIRFQDLLSIPCPSLRAVEGEPPDFQSLPFLGSCFTIRGWRPRVRDRPPLAQLTNLIPSLSTRSLSLIWTPGEPDPALILLALRG